MDATVRGGPDDRLHGCQLPQAMRAVIMWTWHWQLFLAATVLGYFLIGYARRATNKSMIERHGSRADYRSAEPAANMVGTFFASAMLAAIITAIIGFLF